MDAQYPITLSHATLALAQNLEDPATYLRICAAACAPGTQLAYASSAQVYCRWCCAKDRIAVPATDATLMDYLADRAKAERALSTIRQDVVAIRRLHAHFGYAPPNPPALGDFLRGYKREGPHPRPLDILRMRDIALICDLLDQEPNQRLAARNRALLLIGLNGAFRRSELVDRAVRDFRFCPEGVAVFLPTSKTDQEGRGRCVPIRYASDKNLCGVRALLHWRSLLGRDVGPMFPAFTPSGDPTTRPLSADAFYRWFKQVTSFFEGRLGTHSLRATNVTYQIDEGYSDPQIMRITGHRTTKSVHKYDRHANLWSVPSFGELFHL